MDRFTTKLIFRFFLVRTAYTKKQFERMLSQANFRSVEIREEDIGFEILVTK